MSTHKHIDIICVAAIVLSLIITVLFINGEKLGILKLTDEEQTESGMFSDSDLQADWDTSDATVITLNKNSAEIKGNGSYFANGNLYIVQTGKFVVSGELEDGSVIIEADGNDKIKLLFDGVEVTNQDGAALLINQADKVFLTLADNSENRIVSGTDSSDESVDGAIYSRDDLTINGKGSLTVSSDYKHSIVCNDDLAICGGTFFIDAPQDGIHANDSVRICNADITVNAGDDGITVSNDDNTDFIYVESGSINIPACYEGLEANYITIDGGDITVYPQDDGMNATGTVDSYVKINAGNISIINSNGRDADGIDSNKDIEINGGTVLISLNGSGSTNCALDYGSENGGVCKINGGNVIACGSSGMLEAVSSESEQGFIMKTTENCAENTSVALKDKDGRILISEVIPCSFSNIIISSEGLKVGDECILVLGEVQEEITVDNSCEGVNGMNNMGGFGNKQNGFGNKFDNNQNGTQENMQDGNMQEIPSGDFNNGQRPDLQAENGNPTFDMGEPPSDMQQGFGGKQAGFNSNQQDPSVPEMPDSDNSGSEASQMPQMSNENDEQMPNEQEFSQNNEFTRPDNANGFNREDFGNRDEFDSQNQNGLNIDLTAVIYVAISVVTLVVGIVIAFLYKKRKP